MNDVFNKDLAKTIMNEPINQRLSPGSGRRFEPEEGVGKLRERIHKESKYADSHKNLPFSFRKPPKPIGRNTYVSCDNCGNVTYATTATVGIICKSCGEYSSVTEVVSDGR